MGSTTSAEHGRIEYLDALRGIAILAVLMFHAYVTAPDTHPFGYTFHVVPFRVGWVGVQLFFMISGFVILMTLEKCTTLWQFAKRRWVRLFPAMLICSLIILAFDRYTGLGPTADRTAADLIPGLLFISPSLINTLTGIKLQSMDLPYWTLYVEVAFYAVFGVSYFALGAKRAIAAVFVIFCMSAAANFISLAGFGGSLFARIAAMMDWLGFIWFGMFAAGALFYLYSKSQEPRYLCMAIASGVMTAIAAEFSRRGFVDHLTEVLAVFFFASAVVFERVQKALLWQPLLFFGAVSYPLYLVHCNILLGTEVWLAEHVSWVPLYLTPLSPLAALSFLAWLIVVFLERKIHELARGGLPPRTLAVAP